MNRSLTIFGTVVLTGGVLLACSSNGDKKETSSGSSSSTSTSTPAASAYDIAKIDAIKDQFPPGYNVQVQPSTTVTQAMLDQMKGIFSKATFDPPECGDQLVNAIPQVPGSTLQGVTGVKTGGADPTIPSTVTVAAVQAAGPIPEDTSAGKCDKFTLSMQGGAEGSGEKIEAPVIDGVPTKATSVTIKVAAQGTEKSMDQIAYLAQLDDTHVVSVSATGDLDRNQLQDLFVKAVNLVKG